MEIICTGHPISNMGKHSVLSASAENQELKIFNLFGHITILFWSFFKNSVHKQNIKNLSALSSMFYKRKIKYCHSELLKPQQIKCQGKVHEYINTEPKL